MATVNIEKVTESYIDDAVKVHVKASEVPPRRKLNINFKDADMLGDDVTLTNQEAYEESHGKLYDMTHKNTVPWRNWAFYIVLLSLLTCCFTFAKYASLATGGGSAAVAKFNIEVTGTASNTTNVTAIVSGTEISGANYNFGDTGTVNVVFTESSNKYATKVLTFNVTNNSDVTVRISDASWTATGNTAHHTVDGPTYTTTNIAPGDSGTVSITIHKASQKLENDSGTLFIQVDQVD